MYPTSVIATFTTSIVFFVILPSLDIGSDIYLMFTTLTFAGNSLFLSGCRSCYFKTIDEVYNVRNGRCTTCLFGDNLYCGQLPLVLDKLHELQGEKVECSENEEWRFTYFETELKNGDGESKHGQYSNPDYCYIQSANLSNTNSTSSTKTSNTTNQLYTRQVCGEDVCLENCNLLQIYGFLILMPIITLLFFTTVQFFYDDKATKYEALFLPFLVYPQWKIIKYLANYAIYHKDEKQLEADKKEAERNVTSLEPFVEAAIQVSLL